MAAELRRLIADDSYAITFQTFGQYRSALLKAIDNKERAVTDNTDGVDALMQLVAEYGQRRWSEGLHAGSFSRIAEKHDREEAADLSEQIKLAAEKLAAAIPITSKEQPVGHVDMQSGPGDRVKWTGWALPHGAPLYAAPQETAALRQALEFATEQNVRLNAECERLLAAAGLPGTSKEQEKDHG